MWVCITLHAGGNKSSLSLSMCLWNTTSMHIKSSSLVKQGFIFQVGITHKLLTCTLLLQQASCQWACSSACGEKMTHSGIWFIFVYVCCLAEKRVLFQLSELPDADYNRGVCKGTCVHACTLVYKALVQRAGNLKRISKQIWGLSITTVPHNVFTRQVSSQDTFILKY